MPPEISIVIPAYNPQERIFTSVLQGVQEACAAEVPKTECVIVDNRSNPPVEGLDFVRRFLDRVPGARVVREETQGLTFARLAGFRATSGRAIVTFDDDNVPGPGYLQTVVRCLEEYPHVGVWGPGNISIELLDPVPDWLRQRVRGQMGERHSRSVQYASIPAVGSDAYPFGMGQVILRNVAESYRRAVESGELSATDRKGKSLASSGDAQIVWQAIKMGYAAGIHPDLTLLHLIPGHRSTPTYLRRLMFGCGYSHLCALAQSFPQAAESWPRTVPSLARRGIQVSKVVATSAVQNRFRFLSIDLAGLLGEWCGHLSAVGREDHWAFSLARRLRLM